MIIDVHAHVSNHSLYGLHVKSATIRDLEACAKQYGISKIFLMATYFPYKGSGVFNSDLLEKVAGNSLFSVFGSLDVTNNYASGLNELENLAFNKKICGIKLYPGYQPFNCSSEKMNHVYELAQRHNLPVVFHCGELHHCCPVEARSYKCAGACHIDDNQFLAEPLRMLETARAYPDLKIILSHLGNPYFAQTREVMRSCANVYTDVSGQFLSGTSEDSLSYRIELKNELLKFLDLPDGLERIMFGTDFPIQSYKDSLELVEMLDLSRNEKRKILYMNANSLF